VEHIVPGAASLIRAVLRAVPCVWVLATSREPLRLRCEDLLQVGPLAVPPGEQFASLRRTCMGAVTKRRVRAAALSSRRRVGGSPAGPDGNASKEIGRELCIARRTSGGTSRTCSTS